MKEQFDYIIVGAGSAGCVLAERLSRDPRNEVLVLEAGGPNRSAYVTMPKGMGKLVTMPAHLWSYAMKRQLSDGSDAPETWIRGKGLGGSSAINGMVYSRGHPEDYNDWERAGAKGWNWTTMKKAFKAIEDHELGDDGNRGVGGAVHVSTVKYRYSLAEDFIQAGQQMGLSRREDLNTEEQEGVGYFCQNIKGGRRQSAALTFLKPAMRRANVTVVTNTLVERILFTNKRASGVMATAASLKRTYSATREIIVACGTLESPKLLQLSGIGPGNLLSSLDVSLIADSPHVGQHLREHMSFGSLYRLRGRAGTNHELRGPRVAKNILNYYLTRSGLMATGPFEVGAFVRANPESHRPDVELYMGSFTFQRSDDNFPIPFARVEREPGMTVFSQLLRCTSEGRISLASNNPVAPPLIEPNWLSTDHDRKYAVNSVRYIRRYMEQPVIAKHVESELVPGANVTSDEDLLAVYERTSSCGLHAVGTCRIGDGGSGVLDERLRVKGVDGLRVVDLSAMPSPVSGNTNGPAMAFAWRAAELINEDAG